MKPKVVKTSQLSEDNEVRKKLEEMKKVRAGVNLGPVPTEPVEKPVEENVCNKEEDTTPKPLPSLDEDIIPKMKPVEVKKEEPIKTEAKTAPPHEDKPKPKRPVYHDEVEAPKCKKAPETIIGARPLFGQLDINSEFKKAIGNRASFKQKRALEEAMDKQQELGQSEIKVERSETYNQQQTFSEPYKESTFKKKSKNNEIAEVKTISKTANDEIEQICYQQDREIEIDYQTVQEEIIMPEPTLERVLSYERPLTPVQMQYFGPGNNTTIYRPQAQMPPAPAPAAPHEPVIIVHEDNSNETEEDEYRKIPVKSLIQNFEQNVMPPLRYKQIRGEPLPDVVDRAVQPGLTPRNSIDFSNTNVDLSQLSETQFIQEQILKEAEKEFDNLFFVANTATVQTKLFSEQQHQQGFQHAENSSFCAYDSSASSSMQHQSAYASHASDYLNVQGAYSSNNELHSAALFYCMRFAFFFQTSVFANLYE